RHHRPLHPPHPPTAATAHWRHPMRTPHPTAVDHQRATPHLHQPHRPRRLVPTHRLLLGRLHPRPRRLERTTHQHRTRSPRTPHPPRQPINHQARRHLNRQGATCAPPDPASRR